MTTKNELSDAVDTAQKVYDAAVNAFNESKSLLNRKGDKAKKQIMLEAEKALHHAQEELDGLDEVEVSDAPEVVEGPEQEKEETEKPPEEEIKEPKIAQRGHVLNLQKQFNYRKNPPTIHQKGRIVTKQIAAEEKIDPPVIARKGRAVVGPEDKVAEYNKANPVKQNAGKGDKR